MKFVSSVTSIGEGAYDYDSNGIVDDPLTLAMNNDDNYPLVSWKPASPQVAILSPGGDELFGSEVSITYEVSDIFGEPIPDAEIDIVFNVGGGNWQPLESGLTNTGEYLWEIPNYILEDSWKYRIRIGATFDDATGYGQSDNFGILNI